MTSYLTIKDSAYESGVVSGRIKGASLIMGILTLFLVGWLVHLQVFKHRHFATLSEANRVKLVPVAPNRGLIFDRRGEILAQNLPTYSLEVIPDAVDDMGALIEELREIIEITAADEKAFRTAVARRHRFESIPLRLRLKDSEVASFSVDRHRFPGADIRARLARNYPLGALGVHVVGYIGRINERELDRIVQADYRGASYIGKTGIERSYESWLRGKIGYQHVEINAQGRVLRVLERRDPIPGKNLFLTIDAKLQRVAEAVLGDKNGAIVAIEPATGAVLVMASTPGFDPNLFVGGIDSKRYRALIRSSARPLFNRAINGQYPPGSTIKPFLGFAALEQHIEHAAKEMWCPGWFRLPGDTHKYRDWKKYGHGHVDLYDAIVESCDVYFYELAVALGIDRMYAALSAFGFGVPTGIELIGESSGLAPSREWKQRKRGQPWFPGETVITGIGQGFMLATPLQLASATAAIATRGTRWRPKLIDRVVDPVSGRIEVIEPETVATVQSSEALNWKRIIEAMVGVVHDPQGTARRVGIDLTYRIAGKTGTAQVIAVGQDEEYDAEKVGRNLRDHGLFIAFAPITHPQIAVAVVVENGGHGSSAAAPLARIVIGAYLDEPPAPLNSRSHRPGTADRGIAFESGAVPPSTSEFR